MTAAVPSSGVSLHRFSPTNPCPICDGNERMPRGHGVRCSGFLGSDGLFAHCSRDEYANGLELETESRTYAHRLSGPCRCGRTHGHVNGHAKTRSTSSTSRIVAKFDYTDERGLVLYQAVRKEPKAFVQRRPDGAGGWLWNLQGVRLVPYRLPELLAAIAAGDAVWIAEGEKDVDRLHAEGQVATCNPMGAGKWRDELSEHFRDVPDVRIVADRDQVGYRHAADVTSKLRAVGARVRVLECPRGKDVSDHLDAGGTLAELVEIDPAEQLRTLTADHEEPETVAPRKHPVALEDVGFSGDRLLALLGRPRPDPIEPARPVPGHFMELVAPPMIGKTTLALWNAMARAAGVAPWEGTEARSAGRVLLYSIDEAPEQVARRMSGLDLFHPAGRLERYAERIVVIGPDRDLDPTELDRLRFDETGLATLARWLEEARAAGDPFAEVYVDAYADVIPIGESENSNEEATRIGGALERLAVRFGCAIVVLHHTTKPKADAGTDLPDVRWMGRGASALAAKARAVTSLELVSGMPHLRRVRTATNLGPNPRPALFQVCAENADAEEILYFRPAVEQMRDPRELLSPGEVISTSDLARRLAGDALEGKEPSGELKRLAASLRETWKAARKVVVTDGQRKAKMIQLVDTGAAQ